VSCHALLQGIFIEPPKTQRMGEEMTIGRKCQFSLKSLERGVSVLTCLEKKLKALSVGRDP